MPVFANSVSECCHAEIIRVGAPPNPTWWECSACGDVLDGRPGDVRL